jgi:hypothetical protein
MESESGDPQAAIVSWYRRALAVLGVALGAGALAIVFFAPRYWLWCFVGAPLPDLISIQPEFNRAFFALQQLHAPWERIQNLTHRVIEWRLFFPVLAHYARLPDIVYLALPQIGCVAALAAAVVWSWRLSGDRWITAAVALLVATSSWYFVSTGWIGYFDSWLILALLLATMSSSRWTLFAVALIAPWIDERLILTLPLCLGARALLAEPAEHIRRAAFSLAAGVAPYLLIRLGAEVFQLRTTSGAYWSEHVPFAAPLDGVLLGIWHGLRLGWIPVVVAFAAGLRDRRWFACLGIASSLAVNLAVADDFSRSMSVAVPLLFVGAWVLLRSRPRTARILLLGLALGNLLLPAAHIIATPRSSVERYHVLPVESAWAERRNAHMPPVFARPEEYSRRGMESLAAGRLTEAEGQFELALRFDPNFPWALAHRGMLRFVRGEKDAGMADISAALRAAPDMFDVRLQRASFRLELGDTKGALQDVRDALRAMPADWPNRAQAEQFERQLTARG